MSVTKSGIETPTDPTKKPLDAPVKIYPGSSKLGSTAGKSNGTIAGPANDAYRGRGKGK